jgi:hypothetical protein
MIFASATADTGFVVAAGFVSKLRNAESPSRLKHTSLQTHPLCLHHRCVGAEVNHLCKQTGDYLKR